MPAKRTLYVVIHHHRFGSTTYLARSNHEPTEAEVVRECDIDFEEDREEHIEICQAGKIVEIR